MSDAGPTPSAAVDSDPARGPASGLVRTPLAVAADTAVSLAEDLGVAVAADYGDLTAEERAFADGAALVDRSARGAVLVDGPDALKFLQSLLSQDLDVLTDGQGAHALLLQPQGKLDTDLRFLRVGDTAWLDCEVGRGEGLATSLRRFKIRIKAEVTDRTGEWGCLTLRGPKVADLLEAAGAPPLPAEPHAHVPWPADDVSTAATGRADGTEVLVTDALARPVSLVGETRLVRADWPGGPPGADIVGPVEKLAEIWAALVAAGFTPAGLSAFEAARVRAGVPRQGLDIDEKTIPQEAFLELDAVSFTKGCFLGQELVCRIDSRGHVNRFLRGLTFDPGNPDGIATTPPAGAGIVVGDKEVGALTTVARSEGGVVALGYVRRDVEVPADVLVRWDGGEAPAVAAALPGAGMTLNPRRLAAVLIASSALLLPLLAGCSKDEGKALPAPKPGETTTTTEPIDLTSVSLEPIAVTGKETSTTRPLGGGKAAIFGKVIDNDGNIVPGAFVRATYYGDPNKPEVIEALALEDGTYRFEQVLGGRWRVRAWKTPELATLEDNTFFLGYTEQRPLDLKVKAAVDYVVTSSMAPSSPFIGSPVELAVAVLSQSVDDEGVVHRSPIAGAAITLNVTGRWSLVGDATQATEYNGRAAWELTCNEVGPQPITAIVGGREWPLNIPPCHDPAETSTTTATTLPPGASSTSSTKPKTSSSTSSTRPPSYATTSTKPKGR